MRRLAVVLLAVLAVPALALAADTDPKKRINPADQRKAASIVLKRSDFAAGWKKAASTPDSGEDPTCPGYNPDQSDLTLTGEVEAEFEAADGIPSVASIGNVYKTRREALAAWTRSAKPALARCLAIFFKQAVEEEGGKATVVRSGAIAFPKLAPRTVAYRAVLNLIVTEGTKETKVPVTIHFVALGNGRGDSALLTIGLGNGIPGPDLRAFGQLVATRLAAAKL